MGKKPIPLIHIVGLPGAGKTTLSRRLKRALRVPVYRIGTYRARFPQTALGEADAWVALFRDLSRRKWKNCILETTGMNKRESFLHRALPIGLMFTIKLAAPMETLYRRIRKKKKTDQGGGWLFSGTYKDKLQFVRRLFKMFMKVPADLCIDTGSLSVLQVYRVVRQELDAFCSPDADVK